VNVPLGWRLLGTDNHCRFEKPSKARSSSLLNSVILRPISTRSKACTARPNPRSSSSRAAASRSRSALASAQIFTMVSMARRAYNLASAARSPTAFFARPPGLPEGACRTGETTSSNRGSHLWQRVRDHRPPSASLQLNEAAMLFEPSFPADRPPQADNRSIAMFVLTRWSGPRGPNHYRRKPWKRNLGLLSEYPRCGYLEYQGR
jgi:hypothetical protein